MMPAAHSKDQDMRFVYFVASLALATSSLQAAPREGTLGVGKAAGPIMTKAQLRSCMAQQGRIHSQNDELAKRQQQLDSERDVLERESAALKEALASVDRTDKAAVEAYVARAQAHDKVIDEHQARVPAFNAQVEALQTERTAYTKACENRRYLEDDLKDIKAGK
jgi:prefoldin subunit 5